MTSDSSSPKPGPCDGHSGPVGGGGAPLNCPTGFIPVPGNSHYGTSDFCVMKYEAKDVGGVATSQVAGAPWILISQINAMARSQEACDGCQLITEAQWMTIAMDIVNNPVNWSGGAVGNGTINRGNSNSSGAMGGNGELSGINKRTHTLSNGEVIWDLAGNVEEWTQGTITGGQPGTTGQPSGFWNDYTAANFNWNSLPSSSRPAGTLYAGSQGVGMIYTNPNDTSVRAFHRGGDWGYSTVAGVWTLFLNDSPGAIGGSVGFRASFGPNTSD